MITALTIVLCAFASFASTDLARISVNTGVGLSLHAPHAETVSNVVTGDVGTRIRFLYILGLEFAYAPTDRVASASGAPKFDSRTRLSALIHLIPTRPVGVYLKGGVGGAGFADIFRIGASSSSYHAGAGLLVYVADHWMVGSEFLFLIPGFDAWNTESDNLLSAIDVGGDAGIGFDIGQVLGASAQRVGLAVHYIF